jgi:hypothetical protein
MRLKDSKTTQKLIADSDTLIVLVDWFWKLIDKVEPTGSMLWTGVF